MSDPYVTVFSSYDPVLPQLLGDLLQRNDIPVRLLGTRSGAAIGVGQVIAEQHLQVPSSRAVEATSVLEAFVDEPLEADEPHEDDGDAPAGLAASEQRSPLLAAGAIIAVFGGSHLYCRRPWTAVMIAGGQLAALYHLGSTSWTVMVTGVIMIWALLALDLIGGQLAVRAHNRGVRRSPWRQLAVGAAYLAGALALASAIAPHVRLPR